MAITENNFTAEELKGAVIANPALVDQIKAIAQDAKLVIRSSEEENEFLSNYTTKQINDKHFEWSTNIEEDIDNIFGTKKNPNEKYYEYLKRVSGEKLTELTTLKNSANPSEADKARIKQLEGLLVEKENTLTDKLTKKEQEFQNRIKSLEIQTAIAPLRSKYIKGLNEFAIKASEKVIIDEIMALSKEVDGQFVVVNEKGEVQLDPATYKAKTISQAIEEKLAAANLFDTGRQQPGTGGSPDNIDLKSGSVGKNEKGEIVSVISIPESIKYKNDLMDHLLKLGLTKDSPVFNEAFKKFGKDLKINFGI